MIKSKQILVTTISEAIDIISLFNIKTYNVATSGNSSIGAHFRHLIEFIESLIITLEKCEEVLDYDKRDRKLELEINPVIAKQKLAELNYRAKQLKIDDNKLILVKDNKNDNANSSLLREVVFVQSHTTHHFSIIKILASGLGIKLPTDFGLAPSTKAYIQENVHATN